MNRGYKWQVENVLTYNKTFAGNHNLTVVLGQSAQRYTYRQLGGSDYDLLENDPSKANINSAIADRDDERVYGGTGGYNNASLASYFGRIDYNHAEVHDTGNRTPRWFFDLVLVINGLCFLLYR